MAEKLCAA